MEALVFLFVLLATTVIVLAVRLPTYRTPPTPPVDEAEHDVREDDRRAG